MSIIKFNDAYISINNGELNKQGQVILFVYLLNVIYYHNYIKDTISMNRKTRFLRLYME